MQELQAIAGFVWPVLLFLFGGGTAGAIVAKFIADRTITKQKAELDRELERVKAELTRETETHRLKLRKMELLFNKELEAAGQFYENTPQYSADLLRP